jgi:hypothetical protein
LFQPKPAPPERQAYDTQPHRRYLIGGSPPIAWVDTLCHGERHLAIAQRNDDNPNAIGLRWETYVPEVVSEIKQRRGWDPGAYDLVISPPNGNPSFIVSLTKDSDGALTFGMNKLHVDDEVLAATIRSFPASKVQHFYDKDLSRYSMDHSIDLD